MIIDSQIIDEFGTDRFDPNIKRYLQSAPAGSLPLHHATTQGGMVDDHDISVSILNSRSTESSIVLKLCVFFDEIVGGCNCHDDPAATNVQCHLELEIDKVSGETNITLLDD